LSLKPGKKVRVTGLISNKGAKLNGTAGVVVRGNLIKGAWSHTPTEFYEVRLRTGETKELRRADLIPIEKEAAALLIMFYAASE
jgi:hypothetical protein